MLTAFVMKNKNKYSVQYMLIQGILYTVTTVTNALLMKVLHVC